MSVAVEGGGGGAEGGAGAGEGGGGGGARACDWIDAERNRRPRALHPHECLVQLRLELLTEPYETGP